MCPDGNASVHAHPARREARSRLLVGLAIAIEERGYQNVVIADIARHAHVSKRTFYEHFADRDACFVALFLAASHRTIDAMEAALDAERGEPAVRQAITVMVQLIATGPKLAEAMLLDIATVPGRAALERRAVAERLAWLLADAAGVPVRASDHSEGLTPEIAAALAGGVGVLLLREVEAGGAQRIEQLADPLSAFVLRVLKIDA